MAEIQKNIGGQDIPADEEAQRKEAEAAAEEERHERFRSEIKSLTAHIAREAARQKPPRYFRFSETTIGSKLFQTKRFFDKSTKKYIAEEIQYDPSMFWDGPPSAFYALLWHEFGHTERRHTEVAEGFVRKFGEKIAKEPLLAEFENIEEDTLIDSNNQEDRPGLRGPYRACYEFFFPLEAKAGELDFESAARAAGFSEEQIPIARELEQVARRPKKLGLAIKHEAYWHHAHERAGTPADERPPNPSIDDDTLKEVWERVLPAVREMGNAKVGTMRRAELFEEKIVPEAVALIEARERALAEAMRLRFGEQKIGPSVIEQLISGLQREAVREELARIDGDISAAEELVQEVGEEAASTEREIEEQIQETESEIAESRTRLEGMRGRLRKIQEQYTDRGIMPDQDQELADLTEDIEKISQELGRKEILTRKLREKAAAEVERLRQRSAELAAEGASLRAQREELLRPIEKREEAGEGLPEDAEDGAERLAKEILKLVEEHRERQEGKSPTHASRIAVEIDKTDEHHPENKDFGKIFIVEDKERKPEGKKSEIQAPLKPFTGEPPKRLETSLDRLTEYGISQEAHRDYLETKKLVDERALHELVNGLVALFTEDRERIIISNLPYGRLPVARKAEAVRRRYQGEVLPPVYEIQKIVERFMGVDFIAVVDNSGSMAGNKCQAAKAVQLALAHASYRVNSEIARRMRALGISDAQIDRTPPLRYLGILFSDTAKAMNKRGWDSALSGHGERFEDQQMDEESFVIQTFEAYNHVRMGGTHDAYAAALALHEAFREQDTMNRPEERVKIICFITDGAGWIHQMTPLMSYLHGKSEEFPVWLDAELQRIDPGSAEKVKERIIKYKDQIFAIGIGIGDSEGERKLFADVYNEGVIPKETDARVYEDNNVALISQKDAAALPRKLLGVLKAKVGSPAFRRIRQKFSR